MEIFSTIIEAMCVAFGEAMAEIMEGCCNLPAVITALAPEGLTGRWIGGRGWRVNAMAQAFATVREER